VKSLSGGGGIGGVADVDGRLEVSEVASAGVSAEVAGEGDDVSDGTGVESSFGVSFEASFLESFCAFEEVDSCL